MDLPQKATARTADEQGAVRHACVCEGGGGALRLTPTVTLHAGVFPFYPKPYTLTVATS
jgi:hypothetical protein